MLDVVRDADAKAALLDEVRALRGEVAAEAVDILSGLCGSNGVDNPGLANLAHYLAIRHHDLRPLQRRLMVLGLSSLGRMESRVLPTLDAVIATLAVLAGETDVVNVPAEGGFFAGELRLAEATDRLFGPPPANRRTRLMVTMPGDAADDPRFILDLAQRGMDIVRINCAHDDTSVWERLAAHARDAAQSTGRPVRVLMDIAGPKIRTEAVDYAGDKKVQVGQAIRLVAMGEPRLSDGVGFSASVSMPEIVARLSVGDRLSYDDGKLEGYVEFCDGAEAVIRVTKAKAGGAKLKPEKGINLPDTALGLSPLTSKDVADLATVMTCADMIGYSFVSRPDDIDLLEAALSRLKLEDHKLGLVAKIEQPDAVRNLPALIARAGTRRPFGVMIARGDLAAEIGFERLAEMQEEILWICEAAGVPVIWATQVLEDLVKDGVPSRGEMTDAAMAARAECVMLNKGPAVAEAVSLLDRLLGRMGGHLFKKTPKLRALRSW